MSGNDPDQFRTNDPLVGEVRRRQLARARIMAWSLGALAVLFFLITIAKIGVHRGYFWG